jgi:hypothetical protein
MVLRNTAESSTRMVVVYAWAVAGIAYLVACFIGRSLWPYGAAAKLYSSPPSPEAIIVILLLVPGFLYTRLALPDRHTVAGHLRAIPRLVAYLCISSMVALSAALASGVTGWVVRLAFLLGMLVPGLSPLLLVQSPRQPSTAQILARLGGPPWATREQAGNLGPVVPDAMFSSLEARAEDEEVTHSSPVTTREDDSSSANPQRNTPQRADIPAGAR